MYRQGKFDSSQVGGGRTGNGLDTHTATKIRGDKVLHLGGDAVLAGEDEDGAGITFPLQPLLAKFDVILGVAAREIEELHGIKERSKCMAAIYAGDGHASYVRHVDNPDKNGRKLTVLYYLNLDWDVESLGGQLRLFKKRSQNSTSASGDGGGGSKGEEHGIEEHVDIAPLADRLVLFWSDERTPHAVMPSTKVGPYPH
jgi:hypoxia-inducible factor (prolyl hydroxylase)